MLNVQQQGDTVSLSPEQSCHHADYKARVRRQCLLQQINAEVRLMHAIKETLFPLAGECA